MKNIPVIPFTQSGFDDLLREQNKLKLSRPFAVAELKKAREMGDLSENGYYKSAKSKLSAIDSRIRYLTFLFKHAKVIEKKRSDTVSIGMHVAVSQNEIMKTFKIVGRYESNPSLGKISYISPLGSSLMNKKVGDEVIITVPAGKSVYKIIKIY